MTKKKSSQYKWEAEVRKTERIARKAARKAEREQRKKELSTPIVTPRCFRLDTVSECYICAAFSYEQCKDCKWVDESKLEG